eukprot:gene1985-2670_t
MCDSEDSYKIRMQTTAYAGDIGWQLVEHIQVAVTSQEHSRTSEGHADLNSAVENPQEHVLISAASGMDLEDFTDQTEHWCLQPGNYTIQYVDDLEGLNRPGGDLDRDAEVTGWYGGTWTLADAHDCVLLSLYPPESWRNATEMHAVDFTLRYDFDSRISYDIDELTPDMSMNSGNVMYGKIKPDTNQCIHVNEGQGAHHFTAVNGMGAVGDDPKANK